MRILITGGTGQVGTHLREEATKCGWDAVAPGRDELDLMNLQDPKALDLAGIDGVINAAAFTGVDAAESEEAAARQLNAVAPGILAEACARAGVPLVHYSTDYVFDGSSKDPYTEESQTSPLGVYGATKLDGEKAVASAGGTHAILRLSWVFSAQGRNFVKTMLRLAAAHGGVRVVDDQYGRPTPAWSAAIAGLQVFEALLVEPEKAGIYHFSGDKTVTWAEFAKEIFEAAGLKIPVTPIPTSDFPTPASRPAFSVMDCAKIHEVFGIPMADWRKELQLVIKELGPVEEWTS
ncbi:dTDP-4-dehydrorhamnose reductase [Parvularcula marina]|uniref:dTDP-4-dehydrorhamnose reductase n=1 Tax=Parvularcula marina TaxID=2292771 RepID=A0A371RGZ0_9PROT|nr:dTDP-4-dehydrorhamnose reductase [Parvularcula marina]RFB04710.1 dTDP-4-dehydrorhamnose reductase [Parvularcula marina]